jgi:hypothetical protein
MSCLRNQELIGKTEKGVEQRYLSEIDQTSAVTNDDSQLSALYILTAPYYPAQS